MKTTLLFAAALVVSCGGAPPALAEDADPTASAPAAAARFVERVADAETIKQLRAGGFALYLRHGYTDNTRADRVPGVDLNDCATQRPLTEEGRQIAARVGEAIRRAHIPIGDIHVSPLCRARESGLAAFPGQPQRVDRDLMYTANLTAAQKTPIIARTRKLLSAPIEAGRNRLLVAHGPNLMDLMGYFPKEATLVVFRPKGEGRFDYVASIPPASWPELLR